MDTPDSHPASQPSRASLARQLIQRRVPHLLAIYAGASWGLVEFTNFAADEFLLSPHWTRMVLVMLFALLPSVFMFAWFHGKPGRDRDSLARTEKIGIPANLVLCVVVLWALFGGEELGSVTTSLTVQTEDGETVEREVARAGFRKTMALFPLDLGPGIAEDESWISYAVPEALVLDLMPDDFFAPIRLYRYGSYARRRGSDSFATAPLALKRALAQEVYAGFMAAGEIDRVDDLLRVTLRVYRVRDGSLAGEAVYEGTDLLPLVDQMSAPVKAALEIPARDGIEDLPVRGRLSENAAAVEAFFKGIFRQFAHRDSEGAIEYLTSATTLDPSFTVAQYTLYAVLQTLAEGETVAVAPLVAAMENLYRMPERYGFQVKADYYRLTGEMDRAAAVVGMWIELYPNDVNALRSQAEIQISGGDWYGSRPASCTRTPLPGTALHTRSAGTKPGHNCPAARAPAPRRRGSYDDAREAMERAIVLEPLAADLVRELAELDLDIGRLDEARAGYERSLALARTPPQRVQALWGLTHYHHRRGEMADAIQAIEARAQEESDFRMPLGMAFGRAGDLIVYLDAGRVNEAGALLEELQAQFPASLSTYFPRVAVQFALEAEGPDAALEAQRQASEIVESGGLEGNRPALLENLGLIRDRQGDYGGAAESFGAAIALSPEGRFYRGAGRALRRAGLLDQAEAELREALRLVPADPHAHVEMGLLMEARGDSEAAVEHLMSALAVWENADEDFEPARETRAKLAALRG